ncbi:MAG: transketolase [Planctomycetota bacterium]|jgi:transketolase|nr:transketolase [Planctomycetota bacterium]
MRDAFIQEIERLAADPDGDERIVVVTADIGNRMFNRFREANPGRFVNTGIAEANMTGIAAGLAMAGLRPFTYTIASFNPGRCLEQIRLDICQHNLPVTVVGVGAGLGYASLGPTHHALEDIAWLRSIPNMTVLCPCDPVETRCAVRAALRHDGPVYLRLGKKGEPTVHFREPDFRIGGSIRLREGGDAALLAVGAVMPEALKAADLLAEKGVAASVYSFHSVKPMDTRLLESLFDSVSIVFVIEEHVASGGAWSAVAEWLAERGGGGARLGRIGMPDEFHHLAGGQGWARRHFGLDAKSVAGRIRSALKKCGS